MQTKRRLTIAIFLFLLVLTIAAGAVFAYYQFVWEGWRHTISSASVTFTFNGYSFFDALSGNINSDDLNMSLGEERNLSMEVKLVSNIDSAVGYQVGFEFGTKRVAVLDGEGVPVVDGEGNPVYQSVYTAPEATLNPATGLYEKDGQTVTAQTEGAQPVLDNGLSRAIEVYRYLDGEYKFLCNLDKIGDIVLNGDLVAGEAYTYDLRLVYSRAAGFNYEGQTFTLVAAAQTTEASLNTNHVYVRTATALQNALTDPRYNNKTILLGGNIQIEDSIIATNRVMLDLNGFKLTRAEGHSPTITFFYNHNYNNDFVAGVTDGRAVNPVSYPKTDIPFVFNTPNDILTVGSNVYQTQSGVLSRTSGGSITLTDYSLTALNSLLTSRISMLASQTFVDGTDIDLFDGLGVYIANDILEVFTDADFFDKDTALYSEGDISQTGYVKDGNLTIDANKDFSANYQAEFALTDAVKAQTINVGGLFTVRGNSPMAIANALLSTIPDTVNGSLFLPVIDTYSNSNVTWLISDGDSNYLDANGTFVCNGYDAIADWNTKTVCVGVKVSSGNIQYTAFKDVFVEVFGAKQRTQKLYRYQQIVLQPDETASLLSYVYDEMIPRTGLTSVSITLDPTTNEYTGGTNYLLASGTLYTDSGVAYQSVTVENCPADGVAKVNATLTFTYADVGSFVVDNVQVVVLSRSSTYEINDSANALQGQFETNDYTLGNGYEFFVPANITEGVLVEYFVPVAYRNYILVRNGLYETADAADISADYAGLGFFALIGDEYYYFLSSARFDSLGNPQANGEYVAIDQGGAEPSYLNLAMLLSEGKVFRRLTKVTINAQNLSIFNVTANIYAYLYNLDDFGNKVYVTETVSGDPTPVTRNITYGFSLVLKGIYHNKPEEIEDYNLYTALLDLYDFNADGFLGVDEVTATWDRVLTANSIIATTYYGKSYSYLDLSGLNIVSIKGIEYFVNVRGLDLSSNSIVDISQLESLRYLDYLNLSDNRITELSNLSFADNLRALIVKNNNITALEPLRYLTGLLVVDLYQNNIVDFDPLSAHKDLIFLDVRYSGRTTVNADIRYYFALIYVNNVGNSMGGTNFSMKIDYIGSNNFTATPTEMAAATAMNNVMEIKEFYNALYTPSVIKYQNKTFYLKWGSPNTSRITFTTHSSGFYTTACTITQGITEENITLTLTVTDSANTATSILLQRTFKVILLPPQTGDATPYLQLPLAVATQRGLTATYADATYAYVLAKDAIPDLALRSALFNFFNTTVDDNDLSPVLVYDNGGVSIRQKYVLTYEEMTSTANLSATYSFANAGIVDLTGLSFFATALSGTAILRPAVDLRGNNFDDLNELALMNGLTTLYLGGQEYDFKQILGTPQLDEDGNIVDFNGGLTSLTSLYVYECYNLANQEVMRALYMVYIKNASASIFIVDAVTAWDPYQNLNKYAREWPTLYSVKNVGNIKYFGDADYATIRFFDYRDVNFYVTAVTISQIKWNANQSAVNYFGTGTADGSILGVDYFTDFSYLYLVGHDNVAYFNLTVRGNDGRGALTSPYSYVAEVVAEQHDKIYIYDLPVTNNYVRLYGRSVSYTYNNTGTPTTETLSNCVSLYDVFTGRSIGDAAYYEISKTDSGTGFEYGSTNVTGVYQNFATATASATTVYVDSATGAYFISKNMLAAINPELKIDGSYFDRGTPISGLDLTGITSLVVTRDANLGDGSALLNITTLTIGYSGVDLSTITQTLPNLTSISIGKEGNSKKANKYVILYRTEPNGNKKYAFSFMPALKDLTILDSRCYDWEGLRGFLLDTEGNTKTTCTLRKLYIYPTSTAADTNSNLSNSTTINLVNQIYNNYDGNSGNRDFRILGNTAYTPAGGSVSFTYKVGETGEYRDFAPKITDLGVSINNTLTVSSNKQDMTVNDVLRLPVSTYNSGFGATYEAGAVDSTGTTISSVRAFGISWVLVGIDLTTFNARFTCPNVVASNIANYNGVKAVLLTYDTDTAGFSYQTQIELTYSTTFAYQYYFVAVGHIGFGYYDKDSNYVAYSTASGITRYSFLQPILLSGTNVEATGTKSFSNFTDLNLRLTMFSVFCAEVDTTAGYTGCMDATTLEALLDETSLTIAVDKVNYSLSITKAGVATGVKQRFNNFNDKECTVRYAPWWVTSLDGIDLFGALTSFTATNNMICDASALGSITTLTSVNLSGNSIKDISFVSQRKLVSLDVSNTAVTSLDCFNTATSKSSLTTLNLTNCGQIDARQLSCLVGANSLTTLYLFGTSCAVDFYEESSVKYDAVYWLKQINKSYTLFTLQNSTASALSIADITTFYNYYNPITTFDHSLISDNTVSVFPETVGGVLFTKTFNDRVFYNKDSLGVSSRVVVTFTTGLSDQLVALREIGFTNTNSTANFSVVSGGETRSISNFDSRIVAYLLDNSVGDSAICTVSGNTITVNENIELEFLTDIGLHSLDGLQYLSVKSLKISNNPTTKTWTQAAATTISSSLKTLNLSCPFLQESDLAFLGYCTALTTLDLSACIGVDYFGTNTLAAKIKTNTATNLTTISLNGGSGLNNFVSTATQSTSVGNYIRYLYDSQQNYFANNMSNVTLLTLLSFDNGLEQTSLSYGAGNVMSFYAIKSKAAADKFMPTGSTEVTSSLTNGDNIKLAVNFTSGAGLEAYNRQSIPEELNWVEINSATGVVMYLPKTYTMMYRGVYNIKYSLHTNDTGEALLLSFNNAVVTLNSTNFDAYDNYSSVKLRASFMLNGSATVSFTATKQINFLNKTASTTANTNYFVQLLGEHAQYGEEEYNDGTYWYYRASDVFASGRLIHYMFNGGKLGTTDQIPNALFNLRSYYNNIDTSLKNKWAVNLYSYTDNGETILTTASSVTGFTPTIAGSVMTYSFISGLEYFYTPNEGITNLRGIEIFENLLGFQIEVGAFCDISSFKYLTKLKYFYYYNAGSAVDRMFDVQDFSPLVEGAKDTLVNFVYNYGSGVPLRDLSFLAAFTKLEKAVIYTYKVDSAGVALEYANTQAFKTLMAYLKQNRPNAKVYVGQPSLAQAICNNDTAFTFVAEYDQVNPHRAEDKLKTLYRLVLTDNDYTRATQLLSKYSLSVLQSRQSGNLIGEIKHNYRIDLTIQNTTGTTEYAYLAAYINDYGRYHIVDYISGSEDISFDGYRLILNTTPLATLLEDIELTSAFLTAGIYQGTQDRAGVLAALSNMTITRQQLEVLLKQSVIAEYLNVGLIDFVAKVNIWVGYDATLNLGMLLARVYIEDYVYERMLTIGTKTA